MPESKQRGLSNLEESWLQQFKKLEKELMTTVHVEADSLRQVHYREATGSALNILQILHQLWQGAKAYIGVDESEMEDFTLPHIFQVDSTGVQVIFRSPPGVQVLFFWLGAQPNWHASSTWISPGLQMDSR